MEAAGPAWGLSEWREHLVDFLPGHSVVNLGGENPVGAVSAAPWGSAGILPISWTYIAAMGATGLTQATQYAILNANYIARRLENYFPVLYRGHSGLVAHECILDLRQFKSVTVEDVAKRLMDYGFHAPTISWPVPGTMMVEPTESESKEELDRFCDALVSIHGEIQAIESGRTDRQNNLLKNAPHTADMLASEDWPHPYSREQACFPAKWLRDHKFWPAVGRIDNVYGDRNLVCSCAGMDAFSDRSYCSNGVIHAIAPSVGRNCCCMKITEALLTEHLVFHSLFDHIEGTVADLKTIGEIKALASLLENLLKAHSDVRTNCSSDHSSTALSKSDSATPSLKTTTKWTRACNSFRAPHASNKRRNCSLRL